MRRFYEMDGDFVVKAHEFDDELRWYWGEYTGVDGQDNVFETEEEALEDLRAEHEAGRNLEYEEPFEYSEWEYANENDAWHGGICGLYGLFEKDFGAQFNPDGDGVVELDTRTNDGEVGGNDFRYYLETLYRNKDGKHFIVGKGGALTHWATTTEDGATTYGHDIMPVSREYAEAWLAGEHGRAEAILDDVMRNH